MVELTFHLYPTKKSPLVLDFINTASNVNRLKGMIQWFYKTVSMLGFKDEPSVDSRESPSAASEPHSFFTERLSHDNPAGREKFHVVKFNGERLMYSSIGI
jgi:hypothetical protein